AVSALSTVNLSTALPRNLSFAGVQASWDVHDWGRKRTQAEEKRLAEQQASLELKEAEAKIKVGVATRYRRLIEARKEVEVAAVTQSAASEILRVARKRYGGREENLSDVLSTIPGGACRPASYPCSRQPSSSSSH